jgi:hypothetical protein
VWDKGRGRRREAAGNGNGWADRPPHVGTHTTAESATPSTTGTLGYVAHNDCANAIVNTPLNVAKV